jgi:hypothetical protein
MKSYNPLERAVAKSLEALPAVRNTAKFLYHRVNYLIFSEPNPINGLDASVEILSPDTWAGLKSGADAEYDGLFFGYYDKSPWSCDMSKMLLHGIKGKSIDICMYDQDKSKFSILGQSSTWNYQQGCMLQWLPGDSGLAIFNALQESNLIAKIVDTTGQVQQVLPQPIQVIHPNGIEALSINYRRLEGMSEYGYSVHSNNFSADQDETCDGIWRLKFSSGESSLIVSLSEVMENMPRESMADSQHQINHLVYSLNGDRFVFIHRWIGSQGRFSRLYVCNADGSGLKLLLDDRMVSHYSWQDSEHILTWSRIAEAGDHYYLINVSTGKWEIVGEGVLDIFGDGHPSFSPNGEWVITDTYPNRARQRQLLLYNFAENKLIELGRFLAPWSFNGPSRCDLHPRWSPDGRLVSIDSAHQRKRLSFILDVTKIVEP